MKEWYIFSIILNYEINSYRKKVQFDQDTRLILPLGKRTFRVLYSRPHKTSFFCLVLWLAKNSGSSKMADEYVFQCQLITIEL